MGVLRERKGSRGGTGDSLHLPPPTPKSQSQQHRNALYPRERKEEQGRSADDSSEAVFISPSGGQAVAQLDAPPCPSVLTATARCWGLLGGKGVSQRCSSWKAQAKGGVRPPRAPPPAPGKPGARVTPGGSVRAAAPPGSSPHAPCPSGADFGVPRTPGASAACSPRRALLPPGTGSGRSEQFPSPRSWEQTSPVFCLDRMPPGFGSLRHLPPASAVHLLPTHAEFFSALCLVALGLLLLPVTVQSDNWPEEQGSTSVTRPFRPVFRFGWWVLQT